MARKARPRTERLAMGSDRADTDGEMRSSPCDWPAYVDNMAALNGLRLDPARRAEVVRQLEYIEALARRFTDFPLDAEVEPGPVFRP